MYASAKQSEQISLQSFTNRRFVATCVPSRARCKEICNTVGVEPQSFANKAELCDSFASLYTRFEATPLVKEGDPYKFSYKSSDQIFDLYLYLYLRLDTVVAKLCFARPYGQVEVRHASASRSITCNYGQGEGRGYKSTCITVVARRAREALRPYTVGGPWGTNLLVPP